MARELVGAEAFIEQLIAGGVRWVFGNPGTTVAGQLVGADLTEPALDFVSLANGMGAQAHRVTDPALVGDAFAAAIAADRPVLIDLAISGETTWR